MIWWILPGAVAVFGGVLFIAGVTRLFKLQVVSGGWSFLMGSTVLIGAGLMVMVGMNLQTYSRLTNERDVALVTLQKTGEQAFLADIVMQGEETGTDFPVSGDEIRFEARVLKWQPWANIVGYDSVYRLERVSGRYLNTEDERSAARSVHAVNSNPGIDIWEVARNNGGWVRSVDAYYGSGVYVPMVDKASYMILMTQNGLVARPANEVARNGLMDWRDSFDERGDTGN